MALIKAAAIPTEKHGADERRAFIDLRLETMLETAELDKVLANEATATPSAHLFDLDANGAPIRLPDMDQVAHLREDIRGELTLEVGRKELQFEDAHTVGRHNKLTLMHGARGTLTLQLRLDPKSGQYDHIKRALEMGSAMISFSEYAESAEQQAPNEEQAELSV